MLRITAQPGWRWSTDVKPLANTASCQAPHLGYVLSDAHESEWTMGPKKNSVLGTWQSFLQATMPGS
jgi:hypothetical protein